MGRAIPLVGVHRWLSRVRRPHLKAPPAKLHHAATDVDREDDPAPGIRVSQRCLTLPPRLDDPIKLWMERFVLTDAQWAKMEPHCLGKPADPGRSGGDNRRFIEALLWVVRTGSRWRDLPAFFGSWNTVFKRYRDWVKADVFIRLFEACSDEPDMEYAMVDATIVKVHRHGQGAKGGLKARPWAAPRAA